ncbi:MAG: hypothetical protein IT233_08110 [Bacteroidia bacterium]|nr:hypothetical protein [Bacteroidia bacterium]
MSACKLYLPAVLMLPWYSLFAQGTGGGLQFRFRYTAGDALPVWVASGNLNVKIREWSFPFTAQYTNRQLSYSHPFNRIGIRPTHKNLTLHAGYSTMNFSPDYFQGQVFLGGGAEYSRGAWKTSGFYGQFKRADLKDGIYSPSRLGGGFSAGYKNGKWECRSGFIYLYEKPLLQSAERTNLAGGILCKAPLGKQIRWEQEHAFSILNKNRAVFKHRALLLYSSGRLKASAGYSITGAGYESWGVFSQACDEDRLSAGASYDVLKRYRAQVQWERSRRGLSRGRTETHVRDHLSASLSGKSKKGATISFRSSASKVITRSTKENISLITALWQGQNNLTLSRGFTLKNCKLNTNLNITQLFAAAGKYFACTSVRLEAGTGISHSAGRYAVTIRLRADEKLRHGAGAQFEYMPGKGAFRIHFSPLITTSTLAEKKYTFTTQGGIRFRKTGSRVSGSVDGHLSPGRWEVQYTTTLQW